MGVDIDTYRARIGRFYARKSLKKNERRGVVEREEFVAVINEIKKMNENMEKRFQETNSNVERYQEEWMGLKKEVSELSNDMKEVKEDLKRIDAIERDFRSQNVVIYGMDINYVENKYDTIYRLLELFANQMNMRIHEELIDNCFWLGRRKGEDHCW